MGSTTNAPSRAGKPTSSLLVVVLFSYASAITAAFIYLWLMSRSGGTVNLPDVPPTEKLTLVSELQVLPPLHYLRLGETRRYGNVEVTALKVTRGPMQFTHFADPKKAMPASDPVLKLWLQFKNVSTDQEFVPLDSRLLFNSRPDDKFPGRVRTNNFLYQVGHNTVSTDRVPVYFHPVDSEWEITGQELGKPLAPGAIWTTFIPSNNEDNLDLAGDIAWRVHFRKGHNASSGNGVTTLIEVFFNSAEIKPDPASPVPEKKA